MPLSAGSRLGPYEILSAVGAGGMGEVYKARDTRLDRSVAIKVLPSELAADPQFHERFDREARISTAGGTHPRWRRDGKELFYVSNDSRMMAADVTATSDAVRVDGTRALFSIHSPIQPGYVYDVTPDGQRFLVITDVGVQPPLTVVTNWRAGK